MKPKIKIYSLLFVVLACSAIFVIGVFENNKFRNYQRILGQENPYVSKAKGDSVFRYERTDSSMLFLDKITMKEKTLLDLRVLNSNQATLEIWLAIGVLLNLISIFLLIRIFMARKNN